MKKIILLALLLLLSCSKKPENETIEFWQFWTDPQAKPVIESIIAEFERDNPQYKVNLTDLTWSDGHQKIVVAFGAGNPPDLLELGSDWIAEFAAGHALSELVIDTSKMLLTEPGIFEGKTYAHPWFLASRALFFNQTLLNEVGPGLPCTFDALLEACQKIDALGEDYAGFGSNSAEPHRLYKKFLPFFWSIGGELNGDDGIKVDTPLMIEALTYYRQLSGCGRIETQKHLEDAFMEGKLGIVISGGWLEKRLKSTPPDFEYTIGPMVSKECHKPGISFAGGEYLVIPSQSEHKKAARLLISYITREDNIHKLCAIVGFGFPPYKNSQIEHTSVLLKQLHSSKSTPVHHRWVYIETIIEKMVESVILGERSPSDAAAWAQTEIDKAN